MAQAMIQNTAGGQSGDPEATAGSLAMIDHEVRTAVLVPVGVASAAELNQRRGPASLLYRSVGKRLLDLAVTSTVLVVVAPILATVWLGLRTTLGPRVVLRQDRVGKNGDTFRLIKFRTMRGCRRNTEDSCSFVGADRRLTHKSCDDPRHTKLGRVVRKFSLDELPQLINILRGDMSLVGPRPELASVATTEFLNHPRHRVRPGLTGPFQVSDLRGSGDLNSGLHLDTSYVENLGLRGDLRYLAQTSGALRQGTGS